MQVKGLHKLFLITILLGTLTGTNASGSHLGSSSSTSGPPQIHQSSKILKARKLSPKTPVPLRSLRTRMNRSSLRKSYLIPQAAKEKKQPAKPHTKLGWGFLLNGKTQAAMSAYRKALRNNPQSAKAYVGLGITMRRIGKVDLAKKAFLKAAKLEPRLPSALVHLGYLYAEGHFGQTDLQTAHRLFQEASQLGDPFASIALLDMKSRSKF